MTCVADMFIFFTEPVRTELLGMAVFRGQQMDVEYINTQAPHQAEEKTPKSGMTETVTLPLIQKVQFLLLTFYTCVFVCLCLCVCVPQRLGPTGGCL